MATTLFKPQCQWCGKMADAPMPGNGECQPNCAPRIDGKCPAHPSGNPNAPHGPQWVRVR